MKSILIIGGQFGNQGAYLMLRAAADEIRTRFEAAPIVDWTLGTAEEKAKAGVGSLLTPYISRRLGRNLSRELPSRIRSRVPFVLSESVSAVFDISGFRYGDQWVNLPLDKYASYLSHWKSVGVPVYLLPQAFGPFLEVAAATNKAFNAAEMIMARDPDSERYAKSVSAGADKVHLFGDFTDGVAGFLPPTAKQFAGMVPIVANYNIASRGSLTAKDEYVRNLSSIVREIRRQGLEPLGLPHGGGRDTKVLEEVAAQADGLQIAPNMDGVAQKGLIGEAPFIVSGRFHAIVSALSQGVPALIHGWSHKYAWLAREYDVEELVQDPLSSPAGNGKMLDLLQDSSTRQRILAKITEREGETDRMWSTIRSSYERHQRA